MERSMRFEYFEYKGFAYDPWEETDDDRCMIYHYVIESKTKRMVGCVPISAYSKLTSEAFEAWIDCDMPSRDQIGKILGKTMSFPPTNDDIISCQIEKLLLGEIDE